MMKTKIVINENKEEGIDTRLDHFLTDELMIKRSRVTLLIKDEKVLVNHKLVKPGYKLKENDVIEILPEEFRELNLEPVNLDLDIVYEDDDLIVVNKPKGLVVHPAPSYKEPTLVHGLIYHASIKGLSSNNVDKYRPGIVHRIDKDTQGLLLVAKNNVVHDKLSEMLQRREIKREYIALVHGDFPYEELKVNAPIGRDKKNRLKMAVDSSGRDAVSYFKVIKRYPNSKMTLLEARLETGRTHQIRLHLSHLGYPIVGDLIYGGKIDKINGQFLCARYLKFIHPTTNIVMEFKIDLPKELNDLLATLS